MKSGLVAAFLAAWLSPCLHGAAYDAGGSRENAPPLLMFCGNSDMPGCDGCIVNMHGHPTPHMNMIALQAALDAGIQYEVAHVIELSELERDETNSQLKADRRQPT